MRAKVRVETKEQGEDRRETPRADAAARHRWESRLQYEHLPKG